MNQSLPEQAAMPSADVKEIPIEVEHTDSVTEAAAIPTQTIDEESCSDPCVQQEPDTPQNTTENGGENSQAQIHVKFNKQQRSYTLEQATPLVEMGLKWDSFKPHHQKLRYLASAEGKSVAALIQQMMEDSDSRHYKQLLEEMEGNETAASRLFEMQKAERQRQFEQLCTEQADRERLEETGQQEKTEQRLADDFLQLHSEFPDRFVYFKDVPSAVVESAVRENLPLLDAYLRYQHREARRAAAQQARQAEAAARSAGSLSGMQHSPDTELNSFEQAFNTALR